jgi:hypothetical protein
MTSKNLQSSSLPTTKLVWKQVQELYSGVNNLKRIYDFHQKRNLIYKNFINQKREASKYTRSVHRKQPRNQIQKE